MRSAGRALESLEQEVASWAKALITPAPPIPAPLRHAVTPALQRAVVNTPPPGEVRDPCFMHLSVAGRQFIFRHGAGTGKGVTRSIHHPSAASGVTVEAGYDFGARSRSQIKADLMFVGVDPATAETASMAAGLHGAEADAFCRANKAKLNLSAVQQANLLAMDETRFEAWVKRIKVPLHQHEYDALTSFAGNNGGHWKRTVARIEAHDTAGAAAEMQKAVTSGHVRMQGLVNRRHDESRLYLYGEYK